MKATALLDACKQCQIIDAAVAGSLFIGLNQNNHSLSLGLLVAWIGIRCSQQLWERKDNEDWKLQGLFSIIIIGLISFQARTIIQLDDNAGGSIYILIAACLYVGSCYAISQKKILARWISGAALGINAQILIAGIGSGHNILNPGWMAPINNEIFEMGFGRINSLASMLALFTIIGFYGFRTDKSPTARFLHGLTLSSGYFLCLQSRSELAAGAPIAAATANNRCGEDTLG